MFKPTLKKEDVLLIKDEVLNKTSISYVKHVVSLIKNESISDLGASAFIHMLFKVTLPREVAKLYTPTREMAKGTILKSITPSEIFIAKSIGLPILSGGEVFVLKSIEFKGSTSPSLTELNIAFKNQLANDEVQKMLSGTSFQSLVTESSKLAKKAIGYSIDEINESVRTKHRLRFPSFVFKLLNNQKIRTLGADSKELKHYNELVERVAKQGTASLNKEEASIIRNTNEKLISDLNAYLRNTSGFNFGKLDTEYKTQLTDFIKTLSPKDLRMTLTDEKALLRICNNWKVNKGDKYE